MSKRVSFESLAKPLEMVNQGGLILCLGKAKAGKTAEIASVYEHFKPQEVAYITAGELNGWATVTKMYRVNPIGLDVSELDHPNDLWSVLESLERAGKKALILDSIDGCARWFRSFLCSDAVDPDGKRRDRHSGIRNLDIRGYGLLQAMLLDLVSRLYRVTIGGTHVLVTCGSKPVEVATTDKGMMTISGADLDGQAANKIPRMFSDVCHVTMQGGRRRLVFNDVSGRLLCGSRTGYGNVQGGELGKLLEGHIRARTREEAEADAEEMREELREFAKLEGITMEEPASASKSSPEEPSSRKTEKPSGTLSGAPSASEGVPEEKPSNVIPMDPEAIGSNTPDPEELTEKPPAAFQSDELAPGGLETLSAIFVAYDIPLKLQDPISRFYGAKDWDSWGASMSCGELSDASRRLELIGRTRSLVDHSASMLLAKRLPKWNPKGQDDLDRGIREDAIPMFEEMVAMKLHPEGGDKLTDAEAIGKLFDGFILHLDTPF